VEGTRVIFDCPLPPWLVGLIGVAVIVAVIVFIRKDARRLARKVRVSIMTLCVVAAILVIGLVLSPKIIRIQPDPQKPRCALLVDASRSMQLEDDYSGDDAAWLLQHAPPSDDAGEEDTGGTLPRDEVARRLLAYDPEGWLATVRREFHLAGRRFSTEQDDLPLGADAPRFEVDPEGYATALGEALKAAVHGRGGARPRAIILISDGAWNTGPDPSEVLPRSGALSIPVYVVGVGNPEPPRDVSVVALRGPKSVLMGDEVFLTAEIAATGMGTARLPVRLKLAGEVVARKQVIALPSGRPVKVHFSHLPARPGRLRFSVAVAPQEGERNKENNTAAAAVTVAEKKLRVLLIEREPRWEFRFVRNVLERDPAVQLTVVLLRPGVGPIQGTGYLATLPTDKKRLSAFDLVILGDVPRRELPDEFLEELANLVRHRGAALIVAAGRRGHYRGLAGTPLEPMLPVSLTGGAAMDGRAGARFPVELTQDGVSHLMTRLAPESEDNERTWSRLSPLTWSAGVGSLARGARALLVHPYRLAGASKLPLLAVQRVGEGKVLFCGVDETWRWRRSAGDRYHYRFWAQVARWMTKKQLAEGDPRARVSLDRSECDVGESVEVEVYCVGEDGFPLAGAGVTLLIDRKDGSPIRRAMQEAPGGWGAYRFTFVPLKPGKYELRPIVSVYGERPLESKAALTVTRVDLERRFSAQDQATLKAIAEASGGQYLAVHEADQLPSLLTNKIGQRLLPPQEYSPCRHWAYYSALVVLLAAAWLIKKRSGLA